MTDLKRYNSVPAKTLAADLSSTATTIKLTDIKDWGGDDDLTAGQFSDYIPATLINDSKTKVEFILITASTIANAITTGATIYKRGLKYYAEGDSTDNDEVTANKLAWTSGETKILLGTNPPNMYGTFMNKDNDETIAGKMTFPAGGNASAPVSSTSYSAPTDDLEYAAKKYVDDIAIAGSPDMTTTVKGIAEEATQTEIDAGTGAGGTGARLAVNPSTLATSIYGTQLPSADEKSALVGASGTVGSVNLYETINDTTTGSEMIETTIAFVDSDPDTITDSGSGFVTAGFRAGQTIVVSGSASNDGSYTIDSVVAGTITLVAGDSLVAEGAGATVTIVTENTSKLVRTGANDKISQDLIPNNIQAPELTAYENLTAGDLVKLVKDSGTVKAAKLLGLNDADNNGSLGTSVIKLDCVKLTDNTIAIAYDKSGTDVCARIVTIDGSGNLTLGTEYTAAAVSTDLHVSIERMEDDKIIITYGPEGSTANVFGAVAGTISGTAISFGTPVTYGTTGTVTRYFGVCAKVATDKVIVITEQNTTDEYFLLSMTGTTILTQSVTPSGQTNWDGNAMAGKGNFLAVERLEDNKILVVGNTGSIIAEVGTLSGTTLTFGTHETIVAASEQYSVQVIDSGGFAVAHGLDGSSNQTVTIDSYSISGTTITAASTYSYTEGTNDFANVNLCFDGLNNLYMIVDYDSVNNSIFSLEVNSTYELTYVTNQLTSIASISSIFNTNHSLMEYSPGYILSMQYLSNVLSSITGALDAFQVYGIADKTVSIGELCNPSIYSMLDANQSGLDPISLYYVDATGALVGSPSYTYDSQDWTLNKIGRALSATNLLLER